MKFELTTTELFYRRDDECVEELKKLGFKFEEYNFFENGLRIIDEDVMIEFETLEELRDFAEKWGELVFTEDEIEIYNGYRE